MAVIVTTTIVCDRCNAVIKPGRTACKRCGLPVNGLKQNNGTSTVVTRKEKSRPKKKVQVKDQLFWGEGSSSDSSSDASSEEEKSRPKKKVQEKEKLFWEEWSYSDSSEDSPEESSDSDKRNYLRQKKKKKQKEKEKEKKKAKKWKKNMKKKLKKKMEKKLKKKMEKEDTSSEDDSASPRDEEHDQNPSSQVRARTQDLLERRAAAQDEGESSRIPRRRNRRRQAMRHGPGPDSVWRREQSPRSVSRNTIQAYALAHEDGGPQYPQSDERGTDYLEQNDNDENGQEDSNRNVASVGETTRDVAPASAEVDQTSSSDNSDYTFISVDLDSAVRPFEYGILLESQSEKSEESSTDSDGGVRLEMSGLDINRNDEEPVSRGAGLADILHRIVDAMIVNLDLDQLKDDFIPKRKQFLRYTFLKLCCILAAAIDDDVQRGVLICEALSTWALSCQYLEEEFVKMYDSIHAVLLSVEPAFLQASPCVPMRTDRVVTWLRDYLNPKLHEIYQRYYFANGGVDQIYAEFQNGIYVLADIVQTRLPARMKLLEIPFKLQPQWGLYPVSAKVDLPQMPTRQTVPVPPTMAMFMKRHMLPFDTYEKGEGFMQQKFTLPKR